MAEFRIADYVKCLTPSLTLALNARAAALRKEGRDVVSLSAGEPDFDTPPFIVDAAVEDLRAGKTKYTGEKGGPEVLSAIVQAVKRDYGLDYTTAEAILSVGGKQVLYNAFRALCNPGDEVIVPSPYWLSYPEQIKSCGAVAKIVECPPASGFKITPAQLEAAITPRTVAFVLNSPSNPTGAVYSKAELLALGDVLKRHPRVLLISDDLYQKLVYDGAEFHSLPAMMPELRDRTLIVNGLSKAYSMTGWRLGWAVGPKVLIEAMATLQGHSTSNPTTFCQRAAAVALLSDHAFLAPWVEEFAARRTMIVEGLRSIPGVTIDPPPHGAFYAFPDVSAHLHKFAKKDANGNDIARSLTLADACLDADLAVVPGIVFGEDRCLRLSYATKRENIAKAIERLAKVLK